MSVAVLLPMHDGTPGLQLRCALESVFGQSLPSDAIHVYLGVDGPLPAEADGVIENFRSRLHRIVRHDTRVGPTETLNELIRLLEDERLVFRMDADDVCHPERFARQVAFMDAHPEIHILGSAIEEFDEDSGMTRIRSYPTDPGTIAKSICIASPVAHPAVCLRREVLDTIGGYPNVRGQDLALWFEALQRGYRISNLREPLLRLRASGGFFERRSWLGRAWPEFKIYMSGIWRLHGITWRYVFPCARLVMRLSGSTVSRLIYSTSLRNRIAGPEGRT